MLGILNKKKSLQAIFQKDGEKGLVDIKTRMVKTITSVTTKTGLDPAVKICFATPRSVQQCDMHVLKKNYSNQGTNILKGPVQVTYAAKNGITTECHQTMMAAEQF